MPAWNCAYKFISVLDTVLPRQYITMDINKYHVIIHQQLRLEGRLSGIIKNN